MDLNQDPQPGPSRNTQGKYMQKGQKLMVYNVYMSNISVESKHARIKLTAEQVGVSVSTVSRVVKEMENKGQVKPPKTHKPRQSLHKELDDASKQIIRRTVHNFFFRNELPTLNKIMVVRILIVLTMVLVTYKHHCRLYRKMRTYQSSVERLCGKYSII